MSEAIFPTERTFTVASDEVISTLIRQAHDRILFIAPGISEPIATALIARLADQRLSITVILDSDPEVYRLGYGTREGLAVLKAAFDANQFGLRCQPGIRIGVLVTDDKTLIYSPVPQLIEAGSTSASKPNALFLEGATAAKLSEVVGATQDTRPSDGEIGKQALTPQDVAAIKKSVDDNPPEPFDLTQKARVYSSRLQYVEFTVEKYQLTRQTVPIPAYLMGLAGDMESRWRNSLSVMDMGATAVTLGFADREGKDIQINQQFLDAERKRIEKKFLIPVLGFGSVMFKNQQRSFETEASSFSHLLSWYFERLKIQVENSLTETVSSVVKRLLPSVKANIPEQYRRFAPPSAADLEALLHQDIKDAISVKTLIQAPRMKKVYKDIAYQSVKSDTFRKRLHDALTRAKVPPSTIVDVFRESTAALEKGGQLF